MLWYIIVIVFIGFLILLSSLFSAMEMSFVSLNKIFILQEIEKGGKKGKTIEKLYNNPNETVSSILLCNNLVNIAASILAGMIAVDYFGDIGIGIATGMMTFFIVVFGEAIPKSYGINNQKFFISSSKYLLVISKIFSPISHVLSFVSNPIIKILGKNVDDKSVFTEEEIKVMLKLGVKDGSIKKDEKRMIEDVFDFDETKAIELYTPKNRIIGINKTDTLMDLKKLVVESGHSRFPVFDNKKEIIGVVHFKDALLKDKTLAVSSIMKSVLKISPNMKIDTVLRKMQKKKTHMAILESNENRILGLITMEDLIEEVFGEIKDEHD